jgi:trehalose/maltose hydrolase-like predicted phosphorylase
MRAPAVLLFLALASCARPPSRAPIAAQVVVSGPSEDQAAVAFFESSLVAAFERTKESEMPPSPFGGTSDRYEGRVFWDSDLWMFPSLALLRPDLARQVPAFRLQTAGEARKRARDWALDGRAVTLARPGFPAVRLGRLEPDGVALMVPWETNLDGTEAATGETAFQHHVTGGAALGVAWAAALGLANQEAAKSYRERAGRFYRWRSDGDGHIRSTMGPDESRLVDDDLFTNGLAEWCLPGSKFHRPRDETTFLAYEGDPVQTYHQQAALLALFPLQDPTVEREAAAVTRRFVGKTTPNGPAMSLSLEALCLARHGDPDEALKVWRESWRRYTDPGLTRFSETPNGRPGLFLTGMAGCLNAVLYGFVGLRLDPEDPGLKPWKRAINGGWWVSASPRLPKEWDSVTVNLRLPRGKVSLTALQDGTVRAVEP